MSVADYNIDPDSNTSISGINIAEGCPPSGINNAIRQMMADIKTADEGVVHKTGNETISGKKTFSTDVVASASIIRPNDTGRLYVTGGSTYSSEHGARLVLCGASDSSEPGTFYLGASDSSNQYNLKGTTSGTLTWDNKDVITNGGNQTVGGAKTFTSTINVGTNTSFVRTVDDQEIQVCGGTGVANGGTFFVWGKNKNNAFKGAFVCRATLDGTTRRDLFGKPDGTLTWNGQPIQTSSDERLKTPLADIPDAVLDAWGDVGWGQFQYLDAVEAKGADKARVHLGLIAQHVKAVFEARGLDACKYGILCHDEQPATEEAPAVDIWMVRYTEAAAMEAAYQRRRADRIVARISEMERRLNEMEAVLATLGAA